TLFRSSRVRCVGAPTTVYRDTPRRGDTRSGLGSAVICDANYGLGTLASTDASERGVVEAARVDQLAGAVDHEHVRCAGGSVGVADLAVLVEQDRVLDLPLARGLALALDPGALLAGRARVDRQPHDAGLALLGGQGRQRAVTVGIFDERAVGVEPLEHDGLAGEVGERDGLAVEVRQTE